MSKKVVRSRESYIKNWTAAITGSFVLVSAQAAQAEKGAWKEFRAGNPGLERKEVRQMFRNQVGPGELNICPVPNVNVGGNNHAPALPTISNSRHEAKLQQRMDRNDNLRNQSFQENAAGKVANMKGGVNLDLTSQLANITLGQKLFGNTASVQISVGGETKTVTAGTQVTAAEYVAVKQVLAGVGQSVNIGAGGSATGGNVDLSAITSRGDVLKASDLTVPVNVTAIGDFSKGSEFRLKGDLTNSGTVHALDSSGNGKGGTLRADDIFNNANALISSDVDLNLNSNSLTNSGAISSQGNLTITSSNVTNSGTISSAKNVNLNAQSNGGINVNSTGGTISAANDINVNANADSSLIGGDYLSQNLNLNAGAGTIATNLGEVTGNVNSTGYAVHFASQSETLHIGDTNLIDPTFYNIGDITFTGSVNVAADLTVIATGNITDNQVGSINITTNNAGVAVNGGNLTIIAGANITSTVGPADPTLPTANLGSDVTFNQGSISGGSITLSRVQLNTSGSAGGNGGNVLLAAFGGIGAGSGVVNLSTLFSSSITTGGNGAGTNGDITVIAPNGINLSSNGGTNISTVGGTGGGDVRIVTSQPFSAGPVSYLANGALAPGSAQLQAGNTITGGAVDTNTINANGLISIVSGGTQSVGALTSATGNVALFAGINPVGGGVNNAAADVNQNGTITATTGSVLIQTGDDFNQAGGANINANGAGPFGSIVLDIGKANANGDFNQDGALSANGSIFITVGDTLTQDDNGDSIIATNNVDINVGAASGQGDFTQLGFLSAGGSGASDGNVNILVADNYNAVGGGADTQAGQGSAAFVGTVNINAQDISTDAGANIIGNDVSLTANSDTGGEFDLDGSVTANKGGNTTGILSLTQNGSTTVDISDDDITGGLIAQQINLTNNTANGAITILNTNANGVNFRDVTASAVGNITLIEQFGGSGRDGNINFTGTSTSGGTFTVLADRNITGSSGHSLNGVDGDFRSNGVGGIGNIGTDQFNPLEINFSNDIRIQALGVPSATAGNAFVFSNGNMNFGGANSQVTGLLYATAVGDLTTDAGTTVLANTADLFATGNIGSGVFSPFNVDAGIGAGQGVTAVSTGGDVAIFDANDSKIGYGGPFPVSSANGLFSFVSGGDLFVTEDVTASDVILAATGDLDLGATVDVNATGDVALSAVNINSAVDSKVTADNLIVSLGGGTATVNTDVNGFESTGSTGSLTINEDGGIGINGQGALTSLTLNAGKASNGDVFTFADVSVGTLVITNDDGNIFINNELTATTAATIDTSVGAAGGNIGGLGSVVSPTISLLADSGFIDLDVDGIAGASTDVQAESNNGGNVTVDYLGSNTLNLLASSGNGDFTATSSDAAADINIGGNIDGTGVLDLTTNELSFSGAFTLAFDSANVQSNAGSGLTITGLGGTFDTSAIGPGVTFTATDGNFVATGLTNFNNGDLSITLANNNGINFFDVTAGQLNGDNTNDVTVQAALVIGNSLANLTNWANINLIGNTIYNSSGDVVLGSNLTFTGQDLTIIASGNVTMTGLTIDLSSAFTDGGNLTILAGFDTTPVVAVQTTTAGLVTVTGFNTVGGSVDLTGTTIITNSTSATGDAGDVFVYASGGSGLGTGTVTLGDITATSTNGLGGDIAVGAENGVAVSGITTTGGAGGGDVALGVGTVAILGSLEFEGGSQTSGALIPTAITSGDLSYGNIVAGDGDIVLAGAFAAGDTISGGLIGGDNLEVLMGAGTATISTNVNEV
ncbi:MAG: hypothetical protein SGJ27_02750 [Candidatus Melainabacteria bacterium]|nr:hypothetical protein [Candidatus Melainabacteria bacterium]